MEALKNKSNNYLGFIHFLVAGLIVPFMGGIVVGALGLESFIKNINILTLISWLAAWVVMWLGIRTMANRLLKIYRIDNPQKVAIIATIYYVIVSFILFFISMLQPGVRDIIKNQILLQGILSLVNFAAFFWFSKYYFSKPGFGSSGI